MFQFRSHIYFMLNVHFIAQRSATTRIEPFINYEDLNMFHHRRNEIVSRTIYTFHTMRRKENLPHRSDLPPPSTNTHQHSIC